MQQLLRPSSILFFFLKDRIFELCISDFSKEVVMDIAHGECFVHGILKESRSMMYAVQNSHIVEM